MVQIGIAMSATVALTLMSLRANRRFSREDRLPMQWSISGSVNWSAPRRLALSFTPILAGLMLAGIGFASVTVPTRPGQEGHVLPVVAAIALVFVAVHALHLTLIARTLGTGVR
jgi:hypothetical protein